MTRSRTWEIRTCDLLKMTRAWDILMTIWMTCTHQEGVCDVMNNQTLESTCQFDVKEIAA